MERIIKYIFQKRKKERGEKKKLKAAAAAAAAAAERANFLECWKEGCHLPEEEAVTRRRWSEPVGVAAGGAWPGLKQTIPLTSNTV